MSRSLEMLPPAVWRALEEASITPRPSGDAPRAIVQLPGTAYWIHSEEETSAHIAKIWPELTDDELHIAVRYINREVFRACRSQRGPSWASNW